MRTTILCTLLEAVLQICSAPRVCCHAPKSHSDTWCEQVVKQRPEDPLDFLAQFLIKHNPKKPAGEAGSSGK